MIDWDLAVGTFSGYDVDDGLGIQVDGLGEKASGLSPFETLFPLGFLARPMDPETAPDGSPIRGCTMLRGWLGNRGFVLPMTDPRLPGTLPVLAKGESMMFGFAGQFIRCKADGSIAFYTTDDGTPTGNAITFIIDPEDGFTWNCPWGRMTFGKLGFHLSFMGTAAIDLNAISGIPGIPDVIASKVASMITLTAGSINLDATIATVGSVGTDATLKATPTVAALTAIEAALTAIAAAAAAPGNADAKLAAIGALASGAVGAVAGAIATVESVGRSLSTTVS